MNQYVVNNELEPNTSQAFTLIIDKLVQLFMVQHVNFENE